MATLYLSTDAFAAEAYIEDTPLGAPAIHTYQDIAIQDGAAQEQKIGFNPMSSVTFKKGTPREEISKAIAIFHRQGIFAALVSDDGQIERFKPKNLELRELLVRGALLRNLSLDSGLKDWNGELDPAGYLFKLSNSPDLDKL